MKFTVSEHVRASADDLFAVLSDVANAPKRIPSIVKVEVVGRAGEPFGVGTRWRETRLMWYAYDTVRQKCSFGRAGLLRDLGPNLDLSFLYCVSLAGLTPLPGAPSRQRRCGL